MLKIKSLVIYIAMLFIISALTGCQATNTGASSKNKTALLNL